MSLYAAFVDLTKVFDTVSRDGLWKILARLGCPPKFLTILRQLHEGQQGQVKHNGLCRAASPFPSASSRDASWPPNCYPSSLASCSVRQKRTCRTASTSVSEQTEVFNLRRLLARTKTIEELITELLFADDCAFLFHTEEAL